LKGIDCPAPISSFADLHLDVSVMNYLKEAKFLRPTPIQMQSLSCSLSGRDVIGLAETGSGKTLAYTLPLAMWLKEMPPKNRGESPVALIVVPTRELMQQIFGDVKKLLTCIDTSTATTQQSEPRKALKYKAVAICGGIAAQFQIQEIATGVDVVVATPGRLLDLCDRGSLSLLGIKYFVLDEVDRMLGMGLEQQLRKVVALVTAKDKPCQTLLFSATLPESLERLARSAVVNPVEIQVGATHVTAPNIRHQVLFLHTYEKPKKVLEILRQTEFPPVIVFTSSIQAVDFLVRHLRKEQFHVAGLHSQKSQEYRFKLMSGFKDGKVDVLVATDLASRGLDIPEVTHVINYDLPVTIEDYIHRCGRTGRMSRHGLATSFLTLDCQIATELRDLLEALEQPVPKELENVKNFGKNTLKTEFGDRSIS
jgi:superfamily II DNA/RNA helicase